jgi:hypothetical protein
LLFVGKFSREWESGMDARGVQRLLEKTYGMADTALTVGAKTTEVALRDARLPEAIKLKLIPLYGEETLRRTMNYAGLGLAICRTIENDLDDEAARTQLEFFRVRFVALYENAYAAFQREFSESRALEP